MTKTVGDKYLQITHCEAGDVLGATQADTVTTVTEEGEEKGVSPGKLQGHKGHAV